MAGQTIFMCEDSVEGVFTGIYDAWASGIGHDRCVVQAGEGVNFQLFAEYRTVKTDSVKAGKVMRTVRGRLGAAYEDFCRALASTDQDKADAVYKSVVAGLSMRDGSALMQKLQDPNVHKVFALSRRVGNEQHRLTEFLRFRELKSGVLFAGIEPVNDVTAFLAPHFADRLPLCDFLICDMNRKKAAVHPRERQWALVSGIELDPGMAADDSAQEREMQALFRYFCKKIAVESRENRKLQTQMLPLHFRKYMPEFQRGPENKNLDI